tara:strand:- start:460 stop:585 length:126 start_codon:yes stop_codon:yes gene_type:complete
LAVLSLQLVAWRILIGGGGALIGGGGAKSHGDAKHLREVLV